MPTLRLRYFSAILMLLTAIPALASTNQVTIVNHFPSALHFIVRVHAATLPDLPKTFELATQHQISSQVAMAPEAYIQVLVDLQSTQKNAYFGVANQQNQVIIYGYMSRGIAYSWTAGTVTFCSPEVYRQHHNRCV